MSQLRYRRDQCDLFLPRSSVGEYEIGEIMMLQHSCSLAYLVHTTLVTLVSGSRDGEVSMMEMIRLLEDMDFLRFLHNPDSCV